MAFVLSPESEKDHKLNVLYEKLKICQEQDSEKYNSTWTSLQSEADDTVTAKLEDALKALEAVPPSLPLEPNGDPGRLRQGDHITCVDVLLSLAETVGKELHVIAESLAADHHCVYSAGPTKSLERVLEKTKMDYNGDHRCIADAARGSLVFDSLAKFVEFVLALLMRKGRASELNIVRVKNRLSQPATGGYRDVMLNVSVNGYVCELQLHLEQLKALKASAHRIYDILRSVGWEGDEQQIYATEAPSYDIRSALPSLEPAPIAVPAPQPPPTTSDAFPTSGMTLEEFVHDAPVETSISMAQGN